MTEKNDKEMRAVIDKEMRALIPGMTVEDQLALEQNLIERGGATYPITIWNGIVIDGVYRYELCLKHGLHYEFQEINCVDKEDAGLRRMELNLNRRTLNTFQKIEITEAYRKQIEAAAKTRRVKRAKQNRQNFAESPRSKTEPMGFEPDTLDDVHTAFGKDPEKTALTTNESKRKRAKESIEVYAEKAGTNKETYRQAKKILESGDMGLIQDVRDGNITIYKAYQTVTQRKSEKNDELGKHKANVRKALALLQEANEWVCGQEFEFCGENVTEKILGIWQETLDEAKELGVGVDGFQMMSNTGIISLIDDTVETDKQLDEAA